LTATESSQAISRVKYGVTWLISRVKYGVTWLIAGEDFVTLAAKVYQFLNIQLLFLPENLKIKVHITDFYLLFYMDEKFNL
jgi:hypothetical protein